MTINESAVSKTALFVIVAIFLVLSLQGEMEKKNTDTITLIEIEISPNVGVHQGIATDGNYFYLFHTDFIKKTDGNWNEIDINKKVLSEIDSGMNHLGDGDYYDGKLYIPVEYWDNRDDFYSQHIAIWNATDLSYIGKYDISAQKHEVAGIVVDNNQAFVVSYYNGSAIWKYDLPDFSYAGHIPLSEDIENIQGITTDKNYLYISREDYLYKVSHTGIIIEKIPAMVNQGIDLSQEHLYCLNDRGALNKRVYTYKKPT
ncbi:MAG: hypothetical protein U9P70_04955 [Patescibacteria group bacterium]|nr:hypothetical protein [Patescibacteria group bacterium]